ncbi:MAG: hypothetical protein WDL87_08970 [Candidatus Omnitrophota bacterium]|jgi:hypothetical protein
MLLDKAKAYYYRKYRVLCDYLPELIALKYHLKIVTQLSLADEQLFLSEYPAIKKFAEEVGFYHYYYINRHEYKIVISCERLPKYHINRIGEQQKKLLSIPDCCFAEFHKVAPAHSDDWFRNFRSVNKETNTFSFLLNPFTRASPFHLFKHRPCSLRCRNTFAYAEKLSRFIDHDNRVLYEEIRMFLKTPVLLLDKYAIGFEGKAERGKVQYKRIIYFYPCGVLKDVSPDGLLQGMLQVLSCGDEFLLRHNELSVFRNGVFMSRYIPPAGRILRMIDFT